MVFLASLQRFYSGPGQTYSIQNWKADYIEEFGFTESSMGSLYATATVVSGCLLFVIGMAVDRWGARSMTLWIICPGLAGACILSSYTTGYWTVWLSVFLLRFFARGAMNMVPRVVIAHWFIR